MWVIIHSTIEMPSLLMRYLNITLVLLLNLNKNSGFQFIIHSYLNVLLQLVFDPFFPPKLKWGGISSEEHDEAVMLEAAMFGGIPEGTGYHFGYGPHQFMHAESHYPHRIPRPPSPSLAAQRLIREQQVLLWGSDYK